MFILVVYDSICVVVVGDVLLLMLDFMIVVLMCWRGYERACNAQVDVLLFSEGWMVFGV